MLTSDFGHDLAAVPDMVAAADAKHREGDFTAAESIYCRILDIYSQGRFLQGRHHPAFILFKLGRELEAQGAINEAAEVYTAAVNARPSDPAYAELGHLVFLQLGGLLMGANRLADALDCFDHAAQLVPRAQAHVRRGVALQELGRFADAEAAFQQALELDPSDYVAQFGLCTACLPTAYSSEQEIVGQRARYAERLGRLSERYAAASEAERASAGESVGVLQPFYLAYQGFNDRALQQTYGEMVCALMAARLPRFSQPRQARSRGAAGGKIRVGFVSRYLFSDHSVWKLPLRGWVEGLDRDRFEVFAYSTNDTPGAGPAPDAPSLARYVRGPRSTESWCEEISGDALDALIFPEFGMDPESVPLGALRLAPLQMTSIGHPITSGMPTIDLFLSSDLMEPPDGDEHYTERLVRLPNLGFTYAPVAVEQEPVDRSRLGIAADEPLLWCCQSLYKLLPQDDDVFPRIAGRIGRCKIAFIEDHRTESSNTAIFEARLSAAFSRHGLTMEDHCVFLPHMSTGAFAGMCAAADVFLDGIAWSGCNTALEAIAQDLPIVTLAGGLMRARHAQAHLRMMGVTETITSTKCEYVETAARLASDPGWRRRIADLYARNKHKLYHDPAPTRALESLIASSVEASGRAATRPHA